MPFLQTHHRGRAVTVLAVLAVLVVTALAIGLVMGAGCAKEKKVAQRYHCPMHPTYVSDRPGDCPICGMRLTPIDEKGTAGAADGEEGMSAVEGEEGRRAAESRKGTSAAGSGDVAGAAGSNEGAGAAGSDGGGHPASGRRILRYRSPMDPRITSPVPAKDEMGMDFVPVYEDEAPSQGQGGDGGQAGEGGREGQGGRGGQTGQGGHASQNSDHAPVNISEEGRKLAGIRTIAAERGVLRRTIRTVGSVQSDERRVHQVTLKSEGYVERLFVGATGQLVRKGDPILSLYSPDLLAAESEYLNARQAARDMSAPERDTGASAQEPGATARDTGASDANGALRGAEDLLQASRRKLELLDVPETVIAEIERTGTPQRSLTFTAPVSGYVTAKAVVAGMRIEPGSELYTVTDLSKVWIEAEFYEYEAAYLKAGQEAKLTLPYDPAVQLTGKVALIYPVIDSASRTLRVRFETENPGLVLKPGMFANVELGVESGEGIIVPDNAVLDTGDRQLVFVETSAGVFTPRSVRVGLRGEGRALLLEGVEEGEPVVVQANFLLDSESRIRAAISGTAK
jgi:membrane fusion protein, copper/silver efflux system